jgi:hypothetical protein
MQQQIKSDIKRFYKIMSVYNGNIKGRGGKPGGYWTRL